MATEAVGTRSRKRGSTLLRYGIATLLFLIAFVGAFHAIALHPESRILNGFGFSDAPPSLRQYWAMSFQHKNPLDFKHDALSGAPDGQETSPAVSVAGAALQAGFLWEVRHLVGWVGAWNLLFFISMLATSLSMFAFLDWLGCTFAAALFGGYVFGFNTYVLERAYAGHLGLLANWVFVLLAAVLLWSRGRPFIHSAAAIGGALAVAFYNAAYLGLFASFMAFVYFAVDFVRAYDSSARRRCVTLAASSYLVAVVALAPILALYARDRSGVQALGRHTLDQIYAYAAPPLRYFEPSARNPLVHWLNGAHPSRYLSERTLFFGYSTMILAIVAVVLLLRRDSWIRASDRRLRTAIFVVVLAPAAFLMSLAPTVEIGPARIPMPSWVLAHLSTFWRIYARFGILVGFSLAIAAALALTALSKRTGRGWRLLAPLALAVVVLELFPGNVSAVDSRATPPWVAWLAAHPSGTVASYPLFLGQDPAGDLIAADYWYQTLDHHPRFQSAAPDLTSRQEAVRFLARDVDEPLAAKVLATDGVRYAVLHDDVYRADGQDVPTPNAAYFTLLKGFGDVRIYSVHAPHVNIERALAENEGVIGELQGQVPPSLVIGRGFNGTETYNGAESNWMIQNGRIKIENDGEPMRVRLIGVTFSNRVSHTLQVADSSERILGRQLVPAYAVPLHLPSFVVPHGTTVLTLTAFPGPERLGPGDGRAASVFLSGLRTSVLPTWTISSR